jgi:hypothetical protein
MTKKTVIANPLGGKQSVTSDFMPLIDSSTSAKGLPAYVSAKGDQGYGSAGRMTGFL